MKKILALVLALCMVFALAACGQQAAPAQSDASGMKVAMITDYGDITDQSFNQTTYEACKEYCEANSIEFKYYKPGSDSDEDRISSIEDAIDEGFNVIVMPGYAFAAAIVGTVENNPDVTFIALDVSEYDLQAAKGTEADFSWVYPANLYSAVYQEELCGYMAGYAAVKLGYKSLGFLGGMAVPAVIRYGYGFVQGADAAAAGEAAAKVGGKVIGVDVDQAPTIDGLYGEGMTVTSAMKGLAATVKTMLAQVQAGKFEGGKVETLGLVSEKPEENFVQIPMSTQFSDSFSQADYEALVAAMYKGEITVDNDTGKTAADFATVITVNDLGNLK